MLDNMSWIKNAACKGKTEYFYGPIAEKPSVTARRVMIAKSICAQCPSIEPCRDYARQNGELGIWGGETDEDRLLGGYGTVDVAVRRRVRAREYKAKRRAELMSKIVSDREGQTQR